MDSLSLLRPSISHVASLCIVVALVFSTVHAADVEFCNEWGVEIEGGMEVADRVARSSGFINHGLVMEGENFYRFSHPKLRKRSLEDSKEHHEMLSSHPKVTWAEQQTIKRRSKRDFLESPSGDQPTSFNDRYFDRMWYLKADNSERPDMRIPEAWQEGYTGKGVSVTILDDGIERTHDDLKANYDPKASKDLNDEDDDPLPKYTPTNENKHGTRCAGEVAAVAGNGICSVGIAFNASIGGVRMLDGRVTDAVEAGAIGLYPQHIDIYSASWGPDDDGFTVDGPAKMARKAFKNGVQVGRAGKGSIFVWASGNGGKYQDNCNCDGYTDSIYTLSISSATQRGTRPWYSESCSSTLATTFSSGSIAYHDRQIITTDLRNKCTETHTGTSASAPLAAGICALALEANPDLTWRDMQHLVVETSNSHGLSSEDTHEWTQNGVGKNVSHAFGFGMMDAYAMVKKAKTWKRVPKQQICNITVIANSGSPRLFRSSQPLYVQVNVQTCQGAENPRKLMDRLEHVQAELTLTNNRRGELEIALISPSKTRSQLLTARRTDYSPNGFKNWAFMTTHNWGEDPHGEWVLEVKERSNTENHGGRLSMFNLVLYGTYSDQWSPNGIAVSKNHQGRAQPTSSSSSLPAEGNGASSLVPNCLYYSSVDGSCIACDSDLTLDADNGVCTQHCGERRFASKENIPKDEFSDPRRRRAPVKDEGNDLPMRLVCRPCASSCLLCSSSTKCTQCVRYAYLHGDNVCAMLPDGADVETILKERTSGEEEGNRFWMLSMGVVGIGVVVFAVVLFFRHYHKRRAVSSYQYLAEHDGLAGNFPGGDDEFDIDYYKNDGLSVVVGEQQESLISNQEATTNG